MTTPGNSRPLANSLLTRRQQAMAGADAPTELAPTSPMLFVFSGPSGVGKDTIVERLKPRHPEFHYAITVTTRPPRSGEKDEVDYHFRAMERFQNMKAAGEFLESAEVYGNWYGTPKFELQRAVEGGKDVVVKVDVQGAASIKRAVPEAILIFIAPESQTELSQRLAGRKTETPHEMTVRLETARRELESIREFDYVLVNRHGALAQTVEAVEAILKAEKLRVQPRVFHLS